jgi:plastocyanin
MRYILPALAAALVFVASSAFAADPPSFELVLKGHKFQPAELTVPAGERIKLVVKNQDATAAEFESHDFKAEKVVPPGGEVSLLIGPLKAGSYRFYDEFHEKSAQGKLIVK